MAKSLIQKISFCVVFFFFIFSFCPAFSNIEKIHTQWACCQSLSYDKKEFSKKVALAVYRENSKIILVLFVAQLRALTIKLKIDNYFKNGCFVSFIKLIFRF